MAYFLRLKEACQFCTFCVYSLWEMIFSPKKDSTFPSFASNISVVLTSFTLNFEYVVAETMSYLKCALHFVSNFSSTSPPILVPNKYYKSSWPCYCKSWQYAVLYINKFLIFWLLEEMAIFTLENYILTTFLAHFILSVCF